MFIITNFSSQSNFLKLWHYPLNDEYLDNVPIKKASLGHKGDVTALEFLDTTNAVCSSSMGSVELIKCTHEEITRELSWENMHEYKTGDHAACTDVSCFDGDIVSIGEDGRIVLLSVAQKHPVQIIGEYSLLIVEFDSILN